MNCWYLHHALFQMPAVFCVIRTHLGIMLQKVLMCVRGGRAALGKGEK